MRKLVAILLAGILCLGLAASAETALSGKVTVYMPSPSGLADKLAAGFTAATGVEVEQFQGTTGEILARLEAEEANPVADVVILASWSDGLSMKQSGKLVSYTPANAYGWDDLQAMADNGMVVPGANKAALEAVTTGEVGILVAGVDYNAYSSMAKGEPLRMVTRTFWGSLQGWRNTATG